MAIYNTINGKDVTPMGAQKKFLLDLLNTEKCKVQGSNFNGYGYTTWTRCYTLTRGDVRKYNSLQPQKETPKKSYEERKAAAYESWCKRLSKLTGISIEEAQTIANEKIEYHQEKIDEVQDRQYDRYSSQRQKLIDKMERTNPLRRIQDESHARAILAASDRHNNTNYDNLLNEGRELAKWGDIDRSEVKEYARTNMEGVV